MDRIEKITKIQEEYFVFCLSLLQRIPEENMDDTSSVTAAYLLRDELKNGIVSYLHNLKTEEILTLEFEIQKIKLKLESK